MGDITQSAIALKKSPPVSEKAFAPTSEGMGVRWAVAGDSGVALRHFLALIHQMPFVEGAQVLYGGCQVGSNCPPVD